MLLDGCDEVVGFDELEEVEDDCDEDEEEETESPSNQEISDSVFLVGQILIDDLSGFGSLNDDDTFLRIVEVLSDFILLFEDGYFF